MTADPYNLEPSSPETGSQESTSDMSIDAPRKLSPAAQRALAEAEARRRARAEEAARPQELGGRAGPDPVRYGDWENKGIVSDF